MTIDIASPRLVDILLILAKREKSTPAAVAEHFLIEGLKAECHRIMAERKAAVSTTQDEGVIIQDPCSEAYLRQMCGAWWEACWWASSCSILQP